MPLRFSDRGPEFPDDLLNALLAGEVVFLCGTGVSAAQNVPAMRSFATLVDETYKALDIEMDGSEKQSCVAHRYEEVLGSLSRRLADPQEMVRKVSELLSVPANPILGQHRTILRLSRDRNNRILLVTTNFDTLFERAAEQTIAEIRLQSFAGQSLPSPGAASFSGIIHLHGRLADPKLDLDASPLVLTSADYGDAYMRSGWAPQFLFDLARCKTIVLVGYSAGDATVRYLLNVVDADRVRFPDLHRIYALDGYESNQEDAEIAWRTLAVDPIPYCKRDPATGETDYSLLWRDLAQLAEFVERPKQSRMARAQALLTGDSSALSDQQQSELSWLFTQSRDLWPVALKTITDPGWFNIFQKHKLWSEQDAIRVVSAWIVQDFEDTRRFATAIKWHSQLGHEFLSNLKSTLVTKPPASKLWRKAWRILLSAEAVDLPGDVEFDLRVHLLKKVLQSDFVLDEDLIQAVSMLTPVLKVQPPYPDQNDGEKSSDRSEPSLSDLVRLSLGVDWDCASDILKSLNALDEKAGRILEIASAALCSSLHRAVDLDMVIGIHDTSDYSVPSIEDHEQNKYHGGMLSLVRALMNALPIALEQNRTHTRALVAQWVTWPGRLGTRIQLEAMRNPEAYSADEALQAILDLDATTFWLIRREVALALRDRAAEATAKLRDEVEKRIWTSDDAFYALYPLKEGQTDWRSHGRDSVVWLRLKMLEIAGVLSNKGREELTAIITRHSYLDREVEDRDFFGSYSSGVRTIIGESAPIAEAAPEERLDIAAEYSRSPDIERQLGWSSYCNSSPEGAFEALAAAELTPQNITLWGELLPALISRQDDVQKPLRNQLAIQALALLENLDAQALQPIAASIVDLLYTGPRREIANVESWCDRLWEAIRTKDIEFDFERGFFETAITCSAGQLTNILLLELDHTRKENGPDEEQQRARLAQMAVDESAAGTVVRTLLVRNMAFLLQADRELVQVHLLPKLESPDEEGSALCGVLVTHGNISPNLTKVALKVILRGVTEARPQGGQARHIAEFLLLPALALLRNDNSDHWGIEEEDIRSALRQVSGEVRVELLGSLLRSFRDDQVNAETAWEMRIAPFIDRFWPKERHFADDSLNLPLMSLAIGTNKQFPQTLEKLRPYFCPFERERASIRPIAKSNAPDEYPHAVLDLLWWMFGSNRGTSHEMADVLDRLREADPNLEADRRFQALEQRSMRYS